MKTRLSIILVTIIIVGIGITFAIYSEFPRYGATVESAPKTYPYCEGIIQHGFFF